MKKSILIIDDERDLCELIAETLATEGWSPRSAFTLQEATALLDDEIFDLVLMDLNVPTDRESSCLTFVKSRLDPGTPLLVMSGAFLPGTDYAHTLKVAAVITKPFELKRLNQMVHSFLD